MERNKQLANFDDSVERHH